MLIRHCTGQQCKGGVVFAATIICGLIGVMLTAEDIPIYIFNLAILDIPHYLRAYDLAASILGSRAWKAHNYRNTFTVLREIARRHAHELDIEVAVPFVEPIFLFLWNGFWTVLALPFYVLENCIQCIAGSNNKHESVPDVEAPTGMPITEARDDTCGSSSSGLSSHSSSPQADEAEGQASSESTTSRKDRIKAALAKAARRQNAAAIRKLQEGFTSASDSDGLLLRPLKTSYDASNTPCRIIVAVIVSRVMLLYYLSHVTFNYAQLPLTYIVATVQLIGNFLCIVEKLNLKAAPKYLSMFHIDLARSCSFAFGPTKELPIEDNVHDE